MAKKELSMSEIIESHKPKNFKYCYIITDNTVFDKLHEEAYELSNLDTIQNDELVQEAVNATYTEHDRETLSHAKRPTILDGNIIMSKEMVTKADKKLKSVGTAFFEYHDIRYMSLRMRYEQFDIIEIFILT